ncbi:MAG: hypothetical protein ACF788_11820 [Novipirellula sp. JB048]
MSMSPDNPFEPNPNSRFATQEGPPPKNDVWKWVLGILAVLGLLGAVVCCGGGYVMYRMGKGMIAEQVKHELGVNPIIQEQIGEIQSADLNFTATAEVGQEKPGVLVFDLVGSEGTAVLEIQQDPTAPGEGLSIRTAELVMPDGTRHEVVIDTRAVDSPREADGEIELDGQLDPDPLSPDRKAPDREAPDREAPDREASDDREASEPVVTEPAS